MKELEISLEESSETLRDLPEMLVTQEEESRRIELH
jgi:hypothetical protein